MNETNPDWTFFSNYAHVLVCVAENPHVRLRDIARRVGVTERTAARLVTQLDNAKILHRLKEGRRNFYLIDTHKPLRHTLESHCTVGQLLGTVLSKTQISALDRERTESLKKIAMDSQ